MSLSKKESKNLERFLSSDDTSLQMMGLSMAKNIEIPAKFYSQIFALSMNSNEKEIRVVAASFVKKRIELEKRKYTDLELINTANFASFLASMFLIAEVNDIEHALRPVIFESLNRDYMDGDIYVSNGTVQTIDIQIARSKLFPPITTCNNCFNSWPCDCKIPSPFRDTPYEYERYAIEIIMAIILHLENKDIDKIIRQKLRNSLLKSNRKLFDKYFDKKNFVSSLSFVFEGYSNYRLKKGLKDMVKNYKNLERFDLFAKPLAHGFLIQCLFESGKKADLKLLYDFFKDRSKFIPPDNKRSKCPICSLPHIKHSEYQVSVDYEPAGTEYGDDPYCGNCHEDAWDSKRIVGRMLSEKIWNIGEPLVPFVERDFLDPEGSGFGMDFLKKFGSGFYRMKVSELDPELRKRKLKISGLRKEKIRRLIDFESYFGDDPRFGESEEKLIKEIHSKNLEKALDSVEKLAYSPKSIKPLIKAFKDKRPEVRNAAIQSLIRLNFSPSDSDFKNPDKMLRRGIIKFCATTQNYPGSSLISKNWKSLLDDKDYGIKLLTLDYIVKSWNNTYKIPQPSSSSRWVDSNINYESFIEVIEKFKKDKNLDCRKAAKVALEVYNEAMVLSKKILDHQWSHSESSKEKKDIDSILRTRNEEEFGSVDKCPGLVQSANGYPHIKYRNQIGDCNICCLDSYDSVYKEYNKYAAQQENNFYKQSTNHWDLKVSCYNRHIEENLKILVKDGIGYNLTKELF